RIIARSILGSGSRATASGGTRDRGARRGELVDAGVSRGGAALVDSARVADGARPSRDRGRGDRRAEPADSLMALEALLDAVERLPAFTRLLNTLPSPAAGVVVGGLPGSADATLVAALARRLPTRFFVVAADALTEAERWQADLATLLDDVPIALYPPREGFG